MNDKRPEWNYIGRKWCGCYVAACVDNPFDVNWTSKHVAEMIRSGLTVERVSTEFVRENFCTECPHVIEPAQKKLL